MNYLIKKQFNFYMTNENRLSEYLITWGNVYTLRSKKRKYKGLLGLTSTITDINYAFVFYVDVCKFTTINILKKNTISH